ncbi:MAG: hypothetical protein ACI8ZB_000710 [Desulforhopalus sp.]|jgi:hypothetical protein
MIQSRVRKILLSALGSMFLLSTFTNAAEKVISVVSATDLNTINVVEGDIFTVQIKVDNASVIAGAAFTVTYDTTNLSSNEVTSTYFGTFDAQVIDTPEEDGTVGYITVDSVKYYSPQVVNPISTGSMLAAVRIDNGSGEDALLFTLTFQATGSSGVYPISVTQSVITNTSAGYTADPDDVDNNIPFFVGIDGDTYPTHTVNTINDCVVTVSAEFIDDDGDLIDDNWEIAYLPFGVAANAEDILDYFTATGDYDKDGYSDYQEYLNRNERDPQEYMYNPTIINAPNGTNYKAIPSILPAISVLLF